MLKSLYDFKAVYPKTISFDEGEFFIMHQVRIFHLRLEDIFYLIKFSFCLHFHNFFFSYRQVHDNEIGGRWLA